VLLAKLKQKVKGDLVKVLSLTAIANLIKIGINLVTTKVVAVLIGPGGVALVGQFTNLITILTTTSTGGITNGTVRYVSEHKGNNESYNAYISASFSITLFFSFLSTIVLLLFAKSICLLLFSDLTYLSVIYVTAFTLFLYSFNSLLLSIINGKKLYNKYIFINLISSFTGFIFTIILVYFFRVYGALLALATYQSVVILITIRVIRRYHLFSIKDIRISFSKKSWIALFAYSLMAITGLIWPLINIVIRSALITEVSVDTAGVWEGMTRVSGFVLAIMGTAITTYFLPRFSEISDKTELQKEVLTGMKLVLTATFVITLLLYIFKSTIIQILFTDSFAAMKDIFLLQLSGDFFWVAKMILTVILVAKAMTKHYVILEVVFGLFYLILSVVFISVGLELKSVPLAHLIYNFLYFAVMIFVYRKMILKNKLFT
jgi:PST family polysaccharide transporter